MATIQSSGLVRHCQHARITCKMEAVETSTHHTGRVQFSAFHCPDCQQAFEVINQSGQPVPHAGVNLVERSKAVESVRASVPEKKPPADPSLAKSKLNRDGLPQGSVAPEFTLPTLDGSAEVALADYRGRRVLVVFLRADCPPCDAVAPHLQRLHASGFPVLGIANRNGSGAQAEQATDAMRAKAAKLGLTFPILMQHQHRTAKDYASFFTPVAYVVAEDGTLASGILISGQITERVEAILWAAGAVARITADTPELG